MGIERCLMFDVDYQGKSKGNFAEFCKNSCEDEVASVAISVYQILCVLDPQLGEGE